MPHSLESQRLQAKTSSSTGATSSNSSLGDRDLLLQNVSLDGYVGGATSEARRMLLSTGSSSSLSGYGAIGDRPRRSQSGSYGSASSYRSASKLSTWQTSYHLVSFMAGSGMLCLPLALVEIDWYGVLLLIGAALVSVYTSKILIDALDVVRWSHGSSVSYSDLGYECYGRIGKWAASLLVHSCFLITCTGYLSLATSCISGITGLQNGTVLVLTTVCVWFHVFVNSLKALAAFSVLNVAFSFWIEAVIFGDAMYPLRQIALKEPAFEFETPNLSDSNVLVKLSYSFTLLASGFFCQALIPTVYNAMDDHRQCASVVAKSQFGVMGLLYLPICVMSYAVYGDSLQAPVFFNMRNTIVRNLTIVLYCIHLLLSYTITLYPLQRAFESWLLRGRCGSSHASSSIPTSGVQSLSRHYSGNSHHSDIDPHSPRVETAVKIVSRTLLVLLTLLLSYWLRPSTLDIFGYMLVPSTMLSLVLPVVFYWKICHEEAGRFDTIATSAVFLVGVATLGCSLAVFI
ncbi:Amino acid/auxin permease, partial [Globisporangium splendens]